MKRREVLKTLGGVGAGLGLGILPLSSSGCRPSSQGRFHLWTWAHGGVDRAAVEWRKRFARLRAAGFRAVLVSGGDASMLSAAARGEGLEFHRWTWTLNRNGDAWARENHPEWFTVSRNGDSCLDVPPYVDYYRWMCPTRRPVRDYLVEVYRRIASDESLDGVHLDYVRHCNVILPRGLWEKYDLVQDRELPQFDFCYCEVCRETFAAETGADPLDLPDPTADEAWREFRWRGVTELVGELCGVVRAAGKPISAAVFPTPSIARRLVRQAWDLWPLDAVFPMLYNGFYNEDLDWIGASVAEGVSAIPTHRRLHAGLYLPDLTPAELGRAVRIARDAGAAGASLFEMDGLTDAHLAALPPAS